jgi:hypothetical protein
MRHVTPQYLHSSARSGLDRLLPGMAHTLNEWIHGAKAHILPDDMIRLREAEDHGDVTDLLDVIMDYVVPE